MTPERLLTLVNIGGLLLSFALPAAIFFSPLPRNTFGRACLAVAIAWVAVILYAGLVVNPVGIAAGHAAGEDFPEARYDNNTIASALIAGWMAPLLTIGVIALVGKVISRKAAPLDERTPNKSLERTREG